MAAAEHDQTLTMQKRISTKSKYFLAVALFASFSVVILSISFHARPARPLPFDTNQFVITTKFLDQIKPPANAKLSERFRYWIFQREVNWTGTNSNWSFPVSPAKACSVQALLNQCTEISWTRYLMPNQIAAGVVTFGNTNILDGPHFLAATEDALQHGDAGWWDTAKQTWRKEPLQFVRFPEQKVIVVLPKSEVADFLRTNGIKALE